MATDELQRHLERLIEQWCQANTPRARAKLIQQVVSAMQRSGKIWRAPGIARELYEEALHNNWLWFTQNLDQYDRTKASVMVWFNRYLKWAIADLIKHQVQTEQKTWNPPLNEDGTQRTVEDLSLEQLAVAARPDAPTFHNSLARIKRCANSHQSQLRRHSMRSRNEISCDRIMTALLERIEQAPSSAALSDIFAQLAHEWQLDRHAFRRFCSSSCFRLLRQLCPREPI